MLGMFLNSVALLALLPQPLLGVGLFSQGWAVSHTCRSLCLALNTPLRRGYRHAQHLLCLLHVHDQAMVVEAVLISDTKKARHTSATETIGHW